MGLSLNKERINKSPSQNFSTLFKNLDMNDSAW